MHQAHHLELNQKLLKLVEEKDNQMKLINNYFENKFSLAVKKTSEKFPLNQKEVPSLQQGGEEQIETSVPKTSIPA
ncbi:hypothetical protein LXL04_007957 [Taraxacum kok-saghyz]